MTGSQTNPGGQVNNLNDVTLALTDILDEVYQQESKTGMWTPNPAFVRGFQNSKNGQVATIATSGLGTYDRAKGFPEGNASLTFENYSLENDRGVSYLLDQIDIRDSANIPTASAVLAEFSRSALIPEVDAIRFQKVYDACATDASKFVQASYAPAESTMLSTIIDALDGIYDKTGIDSGINIHINAKYRKTLLKSTEYTKTRSITDGVTRLSNKVTDINDNPVTYVPSSRMWSKFDLKDGTTTGPSDSGFAPNTGANEIVAMFTAPNTAQGIVAHQITNIFGPEQVQKADGSLINFRVYHDCIVPKNKIPGCFVITSAVTPGARGAEAQEVAEPVPAKTSTSKK